MTTEKNSTTSCSWHDRYREALTFLGSDANVIAVIRVVGLQQLGLVDFDQFALGDREFDVATFLTEAESKGFGRYDTGKIKQAFLAGYESVAGPLNPTLIAIYCIQRRFAKALHASKAVNPDGERRVKHHLKRALAQALSAEDRFLGAGAQ